MDVTPSGMLISVRAVIPKKASGAIDVTLSGSVIEVISVQ